MATIPMQGPWTPLHDRKTPLEILVGLDAFKAELKKEHPKVQKDAKFVENLMYKAKTIPNFDWDKSQYSSLENRDFHPKVIMMIIAGIESAGNHCTENEPEVFDWYDKLLKMDRLQKYYRYEK